MQELLAPSEVIFYDSAWASLGARTSLQRDISETTGIPGDILTGTQPLESASVARRMSWAANRNTTRDEDIAYCLMGIFSVYMPMLYGEGSNAFIRLQEESMEASDDHTIFAWRADIDSPHGLLADSPSAFADSGYIQPFRAPRNHLPYTKTNRGLGITLRLNSHPAVSTSECLAA